MALAQKQVPPPFKPSVESDESTANFDPEFTSADLREAGVDGLFDEDDPSDQWVASVGENTGRPSFNGPNGGVKGVEIKNGTGRKAGRERGSPLTKSVQENFRGFTYSGESMVAAAAGVLGEDLGLDDDEEDDDEGEAGTDSEWEDEAPAGRYSGTRKKQSEDVL